MRKNIITLLLVSVFITSSFAQDGDKKSQDILKETTDLTKSYKSIKIAFTYSMENKEADISDSYDGTLLVKGNKYNLDFSEQLIVSNGTTMWTYIKEAEEVQVNDVTENEDAITPTRLLTSYPDNFKSKLIKDDVVQGKKCNIIDLIPSEGKSYYKVRLAIDKAKKQIVSFTIYEKNGSIFSYLVKKFTVNVPADDKLFSFDPKDHPGVEVIDMR